MSLSIDQAINFLYEPKEGEYDTFCSVHKGSSPFYRYIKAKFQEFLSVVRDLNAGELNSLLNETDALLGPNTKRRFVNLCEKIYKRILSILKSLYSPNHTEAIIFLERFLDGKEKDLKRYLNDMYINYLRIPFDNKSEFFRILDWKEDEECSNCWHTPFSLRENASAGRYSLPGYPALYLGDCLETCLNEVGKPDSDNKRRWLGRFTLKKHKHLVCVDLRMSWALKEKGLDSYEKFSLLITYPLRLVCSIKSLHKTEKFCEEYLFSQTLVSILCAPTDPYKSRLIKYNGVVYDSTKFKGGINYAIYAHPQAYPPSQDEIYSNKLMDFFDHTNPIELKDKI